MGGPGADGPQGRRRPVLRRALGAAATSVAVAATLAGCSLFGQHKDTQAVSALDVVPGDCVLAPTAITTDVTTLNVVPCTDPHEQEVYALETYPEPGDATAAPYPGEAALKAFADGACLGAFQGYVGSDYRDSSLFFTYLLPSARGWEAGDDRTVTCFITTTGAQRTSSVKGSGL